MSKAHEKAVKKYNAVNYEQFSLRLKKEDAKRLREFLDGRSVNGFVTEAIQEKLQREM